MIYIYNTNFNELFYNILYLQIDIYNTILSSLYNKIHNIDILYIRITN